MPRGVQKHARRPTKTGKRTEDGVLSKMICKRGLQMKNRIWILLALIMTLAFVPLLAGEAEEKP